MSPALSRIPTPPPTVLVVDDDDDVRQILCKMLARHGFATLEAPDPEAALDLAAAHRGRIDVLLADVVLRYMSGRELALRLAVKRRSMRVIYMSGHSYDAIGHHGVMDPGNLFLAKPFPEHQLVATIRTALVGVC
jgi:two-component system, cell cycle sensor histidine kinase and response regulator CckA